MQTPWTEPSTAVQSLPPHSGTLPTGPNNTPGDSAPGQVKKAHPDYVLAERNRRSAALWSSLPEALAARQYLLQSCKVSETTVKQLNLGIVAQHINDTFQTAICIPIADDRGPAFAPRLAAGDSESKQRGQYLLLAVPGLTTGTELQWKRGPVLTAFINEDSGQDLVVCSTAIEAIIIAQAICRLCPNRFTVITSTHLNAHPAEWHTPEFWAKWQRVYFAQTPKKIESTDGAEEVECRQLALFAHRPILRVHLPQQPGGQPCLNWTEFLGTDPPAETLIGLFNHARTLTAQLSVTQNLGAIAPPRLGDFTEGEFNDTTFDIAYNYVGGFYYYPFSVLHFSVGPNNQKLITRETRLLRNDGRIMGWTRVPSCTGSHDVLASEDGTLLSRIPVVSESATWQFEQILAYARAVQNRQTAARGLGEILRDMLSLLEECIWLPQREQLYLLLFTTVVTFVQELFPAVPYLLVQGPKASGKSELAHIMSWLCSNSTIVGAGSHAYAAAQLDQARGLIVLDDRETLSVDELDCRMLELLKIGYKKATGTRGVIGRNLRIVHQHVYGVKIITCINGVEDVIGTRMIRIRTAPYSKALARLPIRRFCAVDQETAHRLRQELHAWTFANLDRIKAEYDKTAEPGSRWSEITAPLLTFANLCDDPELQKNLTDAITAQSKTELTVATPEEALNLAMENLVQHGYGTAVSVTHVKNEICQRLGTDGKDGNTPWACEAWVTRTLKGLGWLKPGTGPRRTRARKTALQRIWELNPERVASVLAKLPEPPLPQGPLDFCRDCTGCEYRPHCPIAKHFC